MKHKLSNCLRRLRDANDAVLRELREQYPVGSDWHVRIRHKQKKLTVMRVAGYEGGVHGSVKFLAPMRPGAYGQNEGRWFRKYVAVENIIGPA